MNRRVATACWILLGYTVVVILWGAYVRATGSGAGCGNHWPLCNGELIPRSPEVETLIELSHRLSSGILGVFALGVAIAIFRNYRPGHAARKGAVWTLAFILAEALIGAGLVRFEWVADNDSVARVYAMAFHLVNTFLLLGVMTLTAWYASARDRKLELTGQRETVVPLALAAVSVLMVGASGAVTALGDTLLLTEGVRPEESPVVAQLVGARFYHPALAILASLVIAFAAGNVGRDCRPEGRRYAWMLLVLFLTQLALGTANVYLKAPVWMQLVHLAVSDGIWILLILLSVTALSADPSET